MSIHAPADVPLTRRQREVLELLTTHLSNKEIARRLGITDRAVKFHVAGLLHRFRKRYDVANRQELMCALCGMSREEFLAGLQAAKARR